MKKKNILSEKDGTRPNFTCERLVQERPDIHPTLCWLQLWRSLLYRAGFLWVVLSLTVLNFSTRKLALMLS
jgi:hypothetical protein